VDVEMNRIDIMSQSNRAPWPSSFLLAVLLLSLGVSGAARSEPSVVAETGSLVVDVANLQNIGKGQLVALVYEKVKRVEIKDKPFLQRKIVPVTGEQLTLTFDALPHGEYAVAIFHDMDSDLEADTNLIGIPREDLAVSNNAKGGPLGGPKWKAAKFAHRGGSTTLSVSMWRCYR
jgi:uncharacterized protein (DUF2141 family)